MDARVMPMKQVSSCDGGSSSSVAAGSIRRHLGFGIGCIVFLIVVLVAWAAVADLAGAVVGSGSIVVDGNLKRVQHADGGIVGAIKVKDGDRVAAGALLIRLDDTLTRANLGIVEQQIDQLAAQRMRLVGERDEAPALVVPDLLVGRDDAGIAELVASEEALFRARLRLVVGQKQQLSERIGQIRREIEGLTVRRDAKGEELAWNARELASIETLHAKELATISQVGELRRMKAQLSGESGQFVSEIARAEGRITETELQILELDQKRRADAMAGIREIDAKLAELAEQRIAALDKLTRIDIRAPQEGIVHELAVHTVGGVIAPGETVMQIVPVADALVAEVRIHPADIDQLHIGQDATVHLPAFSQRTTPQLRGRVESVSADVRHNEQSGESWYVARIGLSAEERARLDKLVLLPGMPVEVFIETGMRSALSYLIKPFTDQLNRAFREE